MKKTLSIIIVTILIFSFPFCANAANEPVISGKNAVVEKNEEAIIPVEIDNNKGIMGFKIMLDYDSNELSINEVNAGALTSSGTFAANPGLKKGHTDIIWSNSREISGAGTIFILTVKAIGEFEKSDIIISFSQEDTFNEKWEDVRLDCKYIEITQSKTDAQTTQSLSAESEESFNEETEISSQQVINAVEEALAELDYANVDSISDENEFVNKVNEIIHKKTGKSNYYYNADKVKVDYKARFKSQVKNNIKETISQKTINNAVSKALKESDSKSIGDVKDKDAFISEFQAKLSEEYPDALNIKDSLGKDETISLIEELYNEDYTDKTAVYVSIASVIVLVTAATIMFIIKRKNKSKE